MTQLVLVGNFTCGKAWSGLALPQNSRTDSGPLTSPCMRLIMSICSLSWYQIRQMSMASCSLAVSMSQLCIVETALHASVHR